MAHHQRAAASSEYVVKINTWGQISDEFLFVAMEVCTGGDIAQLLKNPDAPGRKIAMNDDALRWKLYDQICMGLSAIHAAGLIHMDIKPGNGEPFPTVRSSLRITEHCSLSPWAQFF